MGIEREDRDGIAVLRMNHGKANALDTEFLHELIAAWDVEKNSSSRAVVLTGTGGIFSAGVDLFRLLEGGREYLNTFLPALSQAFYDLFTLTKPVIAAVNGHALAGGCILMAACDHRIMTTGKGTVGVPELKVGVPFPSIAFEVLRSAIRPEVLQTMLYTADTFPPDRALALGIADALAEPDELLDRAIERAREFAAIPSKSFELTKRELRLPVLARHHELREIHDAEVTAVWKATETFDFIRGYLEKTVRKR